MFQKLGKKPGRKIRRKIILKKKIHGILPKIYKLQNKKVDTNKDLESLFKRDDKDDQKPTPPNKKVPPISVVKTTSRKIGKGRRRNKTWSLGVITKRKRKAIEGSNPASDNEPEKEVEEEKNDNCDKNYYQDVLQKYECKLCNFHGKTIVTHYLIAHTQEEVMISRLKDDVAKECIKQSEEKGYDGLVQQEECYAGNVLRRKRFKGFTCRFCNLKLKEDFTEAFFDHIAGHTGEGRFRCKHCNHISTNKPSLRKHHKYQHEKDPFEMHPVFVPKNVGVLIGYLCGDCNYTQLHEKTVKKHIKKHHKDQAKIYKINFSGTEMEVADINSSVQIKTDKEEVEQTAVLIEKDPLETIPATVVPEIVPEVKEENKVVEKESNVFVCPDDMLDDQQIQDERLKKMQEIAEAITQPRRTSFQFLDTLKSRLEESNNDILSTPIDPIVLPAVVEDASLFDTQTEDLLTEVAETEPANLFTDDENSGNSGQDPTPIVPLEDESHKSPDSELSQFFDLNDEIDPSLIDEVLSMENDWSKWSTGSKNNSAIMNTIQRLANAVKQNSDSTPVDTPKSDFDPLTDIEIKKDLSSPEPTPQKQLFKERTYHIGPLSGRKGETYTVYFCTTITCDYSNENYEDFSKHCLEKHSDFFWDGDCYECENNVKKDHKLTIQDALEHLVISHLNIENSLDSNILDEQPKPFLLRMRKLSGDKLSASFDEPDEPDQPDEPEPDVPEPTTSKPIDSDLSFVIQNVRSLEPEPKPEPKPKLVVKTIIKAQKPNPPKVQSPQLQTKPIVKTTKTIVACSNDRLQCKDPKIHSKILEPIKLCHLYKCMVKDCTFTTDASVAFLWHLRGNFHQIKMSLKTEWGLCPYCTARITVSPKELEEHVLQEHGGCTFQCAYCFYRAASQSLLEQHQCGQHQDKPIKVYQMQRRNDFNEFCRQLPLVSICKPYLCPAGK